MKVVIGLGNPGQQYERTRHNVGYEVIDELVRRHALPKGRLKFEAETWELDLAGEKVWLLKPLTYMNSSGRSVRQCVDFFQLVPADLLIVCDDLNLPPSQLRLRASGSDGGQKGLRDIRQQLGTDQYARLRIGLGRPPGQMEAVNFVLSRFAKADWADMEPTIVLAADGVETWLRSGTTAAMNKLNPVVEKAPAEKSNP